LKNDSTPRESWNMPFAELDDLIQQIDDRYIEIRPNPAVPAQIKLSQTLSALMNSYTEARVADNYNHYGMLRTEEEAKRTFHIPVTIEQVQRDSKRRMDLADELEPLIREAKIQGMVHDGTRAVEELRECQRKLSECQEANRKFSQQILEYKNKHILPKGK
jgi:hypothetical protein